MIRQAHRLLQLGMLLMLLALFAGLAIPMFAVPRLGLSVHLLGLMQGLWLSIAGLLWPRLKLRQPAATAAFWLLAYGCVAAWSANLLAAVWGAGNSILPIAAGSARGSMLQETLITVGLRSAGVSLIVATMLMAWGLRKTDLEPPVMPK